MLPERARPPHFALPDSEGRHISLTEFLGRNRIVLLFVPKAQEPQGNAYLEVAEREKSQFTDRDLAVLAIEDAGGRQAESPSKPFYTLDDSGGQVAAQYRASPDQITFYLVGKDGHIAMARHGLPTNDELFRTIDAMPMRRQEMRERGR